MLMLDERVAALQQELQHAERMGQPNAEQLREQFHAVIVQRLGFEAEAVNHGTFDYAAL